MRKDVFNVKIVKPGDQDLWNRCVRFEYDVFLESGYVKENQEKKMPKYDQYQHSLFLMVHPVNKKRDDPKKIIAGIMRLFFAPHVDKMQDGLFPILDEYDKSKLYPEKLAILMSLDPTETLNIGPLAIDKKFRNVKCFVKILETFSLFCSKNRYLYAFASIRNEFLYDNLKKLFTLIDLGPRQAFRGGYSTLTLIDVFDQITPHDG